MEKESPKAWESLREFPEYIACPKGESVRQDIVISKETGKNMVRYAQKAEYSLQALEKLTSASFKATQFYDTFGYLCGLTLAAHSLNDCFHKDIKEIFKISSETGISENGKVVYRRGPIKATQRCQEKAENDYSDKPFPTTAQIVDFIRCSLVFQKCEDFLQAIESLQKAVKSQKYSLKAICRLKNM